MSEDTKDYLKWIEKADKDLKIAQHLNEHVYPTPHDIICYHAQQSIEKALKAFLIYHEQDYPRTHYLDYIKFNVEDKIGPLDELDTKILHTISSFEALSRYPSSIQCDEKDSEFALKYADKYVQIIEGKIIQDIMENISEENTVEEQNHQQPIKIKV